VFCVSYVYTVIWAEMPEINLMMMMMVVVVVTIGNGRPTLWPNTDIIISKNRRTFKRHKVHKP